MLNKRTILILFLLIIAIGTISSVSAADLNNNTISDSDKDIISDAENDEIGIDEDNTIDLSKEDVELTDTKTDETLNTPDSGTFTALQNKIDAAEEDSEITLENNYADSDGDPLPTITKSITILGNGHAIDGVSPSSCLLKISGAKRIIINDTTFKNGYSAILMDNVDYLEMHNCTFDDNSGVFGALVMDNVKNVFLFNCNFNNNNALTTGGAISLEDFNQFYLGGCKFADNYANNFFGGALFIQNGNWAVMESCAFYKNIANDENSTGGAIYISNLTEADIYLSTFNYNQAGGRGGAIYLQNSSNTILGGNKFDHNSALQGGAIYLNKATGCQMVSNSFLVNSAKGQGSFGGAVFGYQVGYMQAYYCDFNKNTANYAGGALTLFDSQGIIESCNFTSNKGDYIGGVFMYDSDGAFHRCNFVKNTATSDIDPTGGIYGYGGEYGAILVDCEFNGNTAPQYRNVRTFYQVKLKVKQSGSTCDNKVIVVTLSKLYKNEVIAGEEIDFIINGKIVKTVKTNSKGQAVFKANLPAKTYTITMKHEGKGHYNTNSTTAKVVIKKATPKIIAAKKVFRVKAKKLYTITLKNSAGKVMKSATVKLTVKGTTYTARTNGKGQATFNLKKLTKKVSTTATIKYAGNGYYNPVTKKVSIVVK